MNQIKKSVDRKMEIVLAAADLLAKQGEAGFSVREVAKSVGIKLASLQYHFPTKEDLVTEILDHVMNNYLEEIDFALATADDNPEEQLKVAAFTLSGLDNLQEDEGHLEIHLWSMALTNRVVRKAMNECHSFYISRMAEMIAKANSSIDEHEARNRAVVIASLQEGSMLFLNKDITGLTERKIRESIYRTTLQIALE